MTEKLEKQSKNRQTKVKKNGEVIIISVNLLLLLYVLLLGSGLL